jgi:hypothetical protein
MVIVVWDLSANRVGLLGTANTHIPIYLRGRKESLKSIKKIKDSLIGLQMWSLIMKSEMSSRLLKM